MPKCGLLVLCLLFAVCEAAAQHPDDEYYPFAEPEMRTPVLTTDSTLFYRAVQSAVDLYDDVAGFNLPQVARKRRGQGYEREQITADGVRISYRYVAALRLLGAEEAGFAGLAPASEAVGLTGGVRAFRFSEGEPLLPYFASMRFSGRDYLVGARASATREFGSGWSGSAAVDARTGRDMQVEGLFTNAMTASFRVAKQFDEDQLLSLMVVVPPSMRGTRLSSVEEAFTLTGDKLYNPAWGFQDGKVRNSRVRREFVPLVAAAYRIKIAASTTLDASAGVEMGVRKYSGLGWYNARTPMPDNYRYLPSYTDDRATTQAWRSADARYTQIRWDELIAQNRMAGTQAVYTLEDRAERLCNFDFNTLFTTILDSRLTLRYGVRYHRESSRNYKQMRDLLGAQQIVDIDQYLVDDDAYGSLLQNNLQDPNRSIRTGDRFGYDYTIVRREASARLRAEYRSDRLKADVDLTLGSAVAFREGRYEKELFPGAGSLGRSRRMTFTPYVLKASAGWAFSPRSYLEVSAMAAAVMPDAEDLFYQPLYNNRTVDDPQAERLFAAEVNYRWMGRVVKMQVAAFATASYDGVQTRRYYDDLAGVYCDMAASGIATAAYGIEAAAEIRLNYRWRLSLAASAGRYEYIRNPRVTTISDVDNSAVDTDAESHLGGCFTGGAPQITGCGGIIYFGPKGWGFRTSVGYAGARYVEPAFVRRTARIARQGGITPEAFEAFTHQERLEDAVTLDASVFRTFYFAHSRMTATLMLRNLMGDDARYNGYESLRVRRIRAGAATFREPQATRYTYIYPRSFYLSVSYKF